MRWYSFMNIGLSNDLFWSYYENELVEVKKKSKKKGL
jgi:hypothetical protein